MNQRAKNALMNGALLLGSIVIFFGAIEIGLRVTGLQTVKPDPPRIYQTSEDPRISIELIPNISRRAYRSTVTTNSLGFRGPELDPSRETIAMFGDSIAFGYGLEDDETIAAQLGKLLPDYNVLNTASPGHNLQQQAAVYETKVKKLDPAAIILIFHWNDFTEEIPFLDSHGIVRPEGWTPDEPDCIPVTEGILRLVPAQCWLESHSAFYKAFKKLINRRYAKEQLALTRKQSKEKPQEDNITNEDLQLYARQLDHFVALLRQGMPRFFVIWPDRFLHEVSKPKLIAIAKQRGFTVLDLYDTFGNEVPVLGWDTVHPNAEGVEEAAEVLGETLRDML